MKVIYLGSPQESIYPLEYLIKNKEHGKYEILAVVSQAPKTAGRGRQEMDPPLARYAKEAGILTLQPVKASDADFQEQLKSLAPDIMITCAYGQILNESFLKIPKRATINIHPSLLPKYRGATPVQTALLDGLKETGISILFTVKELDAGNLILQKREPIHDYETSGELMTRLFTLSGPLVFDALQLLKDKTFLGIKQDPSQVTLCKKIKKEDGKLDWNLEKKTLINQFRAYHPWPTSYSFLNGKRIIFSDLKATDSLAKEEPGTLVFKKEEKSIYIACSDGWVKTQSLKTEGSRVLNALEFWNGLKNKQNLKFSNSEH